MSEGQRDLRFLIKTSPYPSPNLGEGNHEVMGEVNIESFLLKSSGSAIHLL